MAELKRTFKEEKNEYKKVVAKPNAKLIAQLIAVGIALFFTIPFYFMVGNLFIFINISKIIIFPVIMIYAILSSGRRWVYYDILKNYHEEFKNINFKKLFIGKGLTDLAIIIGIFVGLLF